MNSAGEQTIRQKIVKHIKGGQAFSTIDKIADKVPYNQIGKRPDGLPYSFYQLFYHIRIAQLDILKYCRNPDYEEIAWPDDYWPANDRPDDEEAWLDLKEKFFRERDEFCDLILDEKNDLTSPFASNPDHNLFRQAQLIIEHNSYHTGQLYMIARLLDR